VLELRVPHHLVAMIRGLHPEIKRKIRGSLKTLVTEPHTGTLLKNELEELRSLKVQRLRIIYRINHAYPVSTGSFASAEFARLCPLS
jgi:mRNA interferase RelE/StbE